MPNFQRDHIIMQSKQVLSHCARINDKHLLDCKFEAILARFSFSIAVNLSTICWNQLESHDFTNPVRSNGSQALAISDTLKALTPITVDYDITKDVKVFTV